MRELVTKPPMIEFNDDLERRLATAPVGSSFNGKVRNEGAFDRIFYNAMYKYERNYFVRSVVPTTDVEGNQYTEIPADVGLELQARYQRQDMMFNQRQLCLEPEFVYQDEEYMGNLFNGYTDVIERVMSSKDLIDLEFYFRSASDDEREALKQNFGKVREKAFELWIDGIGAVDRRTVIRINSGRYDYKYTIDNLLNSVEQWAGIDTKTRELLPIEQMGVRGVPKNYDTTVEIPAMSKEQNTVSSSQNNKEGLNIVSNIEQTKEEKTGFWERTNSWAMVMDDLIVGSISFLESGIERAVVTGKKVMDRYNQGLIGTVTLGRKWANIFIERQQELVAKKQEKKQKEISKALERQGDANQHNSEVWEEWKIKLAQRAGDANKRIALFNSGRK